MTTTTLQPPRRGVARESILSRSTAMLVMVICAFYFLVPIWWLLVAATKDRAQFTSTAALWFGDVNILQNLTDLVTYRDGVFFRWMLNSVLYAGGGAALATVFASMAGYAIAKYSFRGRELAFNVILGGVLVPATALALPLFLLFSQVGATNTFWSVLDRKSVV